MRSFTLVGAALAGCYQPKVAQNVPCGPGGACPTGQACDVDELCRSSPLDASPPVDAAPDAELVDARLIDARIADASADAPPPLPWSLVQVTESNVATNALAATGAGHLILVAVLTNQVKVTSVSDDAGNTYALVPQSRCDDANDKLGAELWYAKSAHAGATMVSINAPTVYGDVVWEVANISPTNPIDAATTLDSQASTTMPAGAGISTARAGEFVVAIAILQNMASQIATGSAFTNDVFTAGNGWAHLTDDMAAAGHYIATWLQPSGGTYCAVSAAFFVGP